MVKAVILGLRLFYRDFEMLSGIFIKDNVAYTRSKEEITVTSRAAYARNEQETSMTVT